MFAKLKQKIQDEGFDVKTDLIKSFGASPINSSSTSLNQIASGETTPAKSALSPAQNRRSASVSSRLGHSRNSSSESINENGSPIHNSASVQKEFTISDVMGTPERQTLPKETDAIINELKKTLKEERRRREKVENTLEKQQDILKKRLDEKIQEFTTQIERVGKEKSELEAKLLEASVWKDKYIRDHEAAEELEGFKTQELAKVKHLLLMCQQDLQQSENTRKHLEEDFEKLKHKYAGVEEDTERLKWKCNKLEEESTHLKENLAKDESLLKEFKEVKESLGKNALELNWQLEETRMKSTMLEKSLSTLQDEYDAYKHNQSLHISKTDSLLDEKNAAISYYEERIQILERRLADSNLGDDERVQALLTERTTLEDKLEESRQHLNEVKSNWSDKIATLENQIANLNLKMADDREEGLRNENVLRAENLQLQTKVSELQQQIEEANILSSSLATKIEQKEEEFRKQKIDHRREIEQAYHDKEEASRLLGERVQSFESRMAILERERDEEYQRYQNKIALLESRDTDHLSKENELEKRIDKLRDDKGKLEKIQEELEIKIKDLKKSHEESNSTIGSLTKQIEELNADLENKSEMLESSGKKYTELEAVLQAAEREREDLLSKNAELVNRLGEMNSEIEAFQNERKTENENVQKQFCELHDTLAAADQDRCALKEKIVDLENSLDADHIENLDRVVQLKDSISDLENQLTEKNKTIKLQQQRLSDMKKTLQRELKVQPSASEGTIESSVKDGVASMQMHLSRMMDVPIGTFVHDRPVSLADKLDDINFRYIKHVILKFMTSREYEAQQLVKAIGVLLDFTTEEERLVRETLDWKMSWFGSKPQVNRPHVGNRTIMS